MLFLCNIPMGGIVFSVFWFFSFGQRIFAITCGREDSHALLPFPPELLFHGMYLIQSSNPYIHLICVLVLLVTRTVHVRGILSCLNRRSIERHLSCLRFCMISRSSIASFLRILLLKVRGSEILCLVSEVRVWFCWDSTIAAHLEKLMFDVLKTTHASQIVSRVRYTQIVCFGCDGHLCDMLSSGYVTQNGRFEWSCGAEHVDTIDTPIGICVLRNRPWLRPCNSSCRGALQIFSKKYVWIHFPNFSTSIEEIVWTHS